MKPDSIRRIRKFFGSIGAEEIIRRINFGLLTFFVLTMPLVIYLKNSEYGYTKNIYMFVVISFLLLTYALGFVISDKASFSLTEIIYGLLSVLAAGALSAVNASSVGVIIQSLALICYFILFYLLVVNTVRKEWELSALLYAALLAALGAIIYGFLQYFGIAAGGEGSNQMISTMGNKNYLAGFITYLFFPGLALFTATKSNILKIFSGIVLTSTFVILFPIASRGAWLGLIIGGLFALGGLLFSRPFGILTENRTWLIAVIVLLIVSFFLVGAPGPLNSVISQSAPEEGTGNSWGVLSPLLKPIYRQLVKKGGARIEDWYIGWEMLKDHPLTGIGLGNYKIKFGEYRSIFLNTKRGESFGGYIPRGAQAHNEYVQFAAETGIVGIFSVLFLLISLAWVGVKRIKKATGDRKKIISIALFAGSAGFLIHSAVSFPAHLPASSLNIALFFGLLNSQALGERKLNVELKGMKATIIAFLIVSFVIPVSVFAYRDWRANILMQKGVNQMKFGNYRLAKGTLKDSLNKDFYPRQTHFYLGVAKRELGKKGKAIEYFEKCKGRFEPYKLYLQLGSLYLGENKYERAEKYLKKFISRDPKKGQRKEARYFLARAALGKGEAKKGEEIIYDILKEDENYQKALILLSKLREKQGKIDRARQVLKKAKNIIQEKLNKVESRMKGSMALDRYHELNSKKGTLQNQKKIVQRALKELS